MKTFLESLREHLQFLPGEESHATVMPLNRPYSSQALLHAEGIRQSAVGLILYPQDEQLRCILIQRPSYEGTHSDQIAFPGGKMDADDPDLEYTARRECFEEISLPLHYGNCLGTLTQVYIPISQFLVHPYLFFVEALPELKPNPREVAEILSFPVFDLLKEDVLQQTDMRFKDGIIRKNIPYFALEDKIVWGATAMMLAEFREILKRF